MWIAIMVVRGEERANCAVEALEREGIPAKKWPVFKSQVDGAGEYELRVLASEADEALELLIREGIR